MKKSRIFLCNIKYVFSNEKYVALASLYCHGEEGKKGDRKSINIFHFTISILLVALTVAQQSTSRSREKNCDRVILCGLFFFNIFHLITRTFLVAGAGRVFISVGASATATAAVVVEMRIYYGN